MSPRVSVVIPTRGRETRLAFALEALARQTIGADQFEVIVVRDADAAATSEAPGSITVRDEQIEAVAGPAPKRNLGWRTAAAPLVAFTDDDCRPTPEWLESLLAVADATPGAVVQGRTEPDPDEVHLMHGFARTIEISTATEWFETCNIAYPRALLEGLDGFDETFDFIGDDTDLGLRARELGAERVFAPDALVHHAVEHRTLPAALRAAYARRGTAAIVAKHPRQRQALFLGLFSYRNHARLLLALGGMALVRRAPLLAAAAALPYLWFNVDRGRLRSPIGLLRTPLTLAGRVAVHSAEIAANVTESIRRRSAVL